MYVQSSSGSTSSSSSGDTTKLNICNYDSFCSMIEFNHVAWDELRASGIQLVMWVWNKTILKIVYMC